MGGRTREKERNGLHVAAYVNDDQEIEAAIEELKRLYNRAGIERSAAIGGFILKRFFGGSEQQWRSRERNKNNSVRRLVKHPDCPLKDKALRDAIQIHLIVGALPWILDCTNVRARHLIIVAKLSTDEKAEWLQRVEHAAWTCEELQRQLRAREDGFGKALGRPRHSPRRKAASAVRSAVKKLQKATDSLLVLELDAEADSELDRVADAVALIESKLRQRGRPPLSGLRALKKAAAQ